MHQKIFCDRCGKILDIKEEGDKTIGICTNCNLKKDIPFKFIRSEKLPEKEVLGKGVIKEEITPGFPHVCTKCGYGECDLDDVGASYADESDIYLYRCKKCGYVERQADGTGNK